MLTKKTLRMLCHALVYRYSHINYGILSWETAGKNTLKPSNVLLNRLIKCITFTPAKVRLSPLYSTSNLLQLNDVYNVGLRHFMYKYHNSMLPSNFYDYFIHLDSVHHHNTRQSCTTGLFLQRMNAKKA